jgi:hypothetical protein
VVVGVVLVVVIPPEQVALAVVETVRLVLELPALELLIPEVVEAVVDL